MSYYIQFFEKLISKLRTDGIYIIEDVSHSDMIKYKKYFSKLEHLYETRFVYLSSPIRLYGDNNNLISITKKIFILPTSWMFFFRPMCFQCVLTEQPVCPQKPLLQNPTSGPTMSPNQCKSMKIQGSAHRVTLFGWDAGPQRSRPFVERWPLTMHAYILAFPNIVYRCIQGIQAK